MSMCWENKCSRCGKEFDTSHPQSVCGNCWTDKDKVELLKLNKLELSGEKWECLFGKVESVILGINNELPPIIKQKAEEVSCVLDKYMSRPNWKVLGAYMKWTNGPIVIYVGQIYEDCNENEEEMLKSVRQVYLHELAHAVGNLAEYQVKERGL